jgi:acyl-CoA dehydrogenase
LTPELKELQKRTRRFVERELIPHEMTVDTTEALPKETRARIQQRALDCGLWPMNVPKEMGGLGSSVMEQTIVQRSRRAARRTVCGLTWAARITR